MGLFAPVDHFKIYDGVVDSGGGVDFTTLQAGDDELDAAAYSMWVKQATYDAGLTVSTNNVFVFLESGTIVQGDIVLSGTGITLVLGGGCDIQGTVTISGIGSQVLCHNACDLDGVIMSADDGLFDGGGWDTLVNGSAARHAINISGDDCIARNCAVQTTSGGGSSFEGIIGSSDRVMIDRVKVISADDRGFQLSGGDNLVTNCLILDSDLDGIRINGPRARVIGNYIISAGGDGIQLTDGADNSICTGNIVKDQTNQSIDINTDGEDCVVVSNRVDGAVADNSGTSTVASNDATAF